MDKERQNQENDETIQKIQQKVKKIVFKVNNHLLKHLESFSEYFYYLLIVIESLQILWFSIHPTFHFLDASIGMSQLQTALRYVSVEYYLRENPGSWAVCMVVAFAITIVHLITLAITGYLLLKKSVTDAAEMLAKISNIQIMLMNTVLTGPFFNIVATTLYCDTHSPYHLGETCYTPTGIVYCVLGCIVGLILLIEGGLYGFLYYIKNPFSRGCLSTPSNIYYVGKLCLKTLPSLYFIIDTQFLYMHVYIFAFVIVFAGYIFLFRMWSHHTFDEKYHYFVYSCEISLTWMGLVNILHFYLSNPDRPNLNLIFSLIGIIPLCYTFLKLQKQSKKKIFLEGIRNLKKNKDVAEEFIYMVISLIETSSIHKNKIQLLGFMKIHNGGCQQQESKCNCHQFFQAFYQKKKLSPTDEVNAFYEFLKHTLSSYIKKYSGHVMFKIIYSYLLYYKLESKIQSIFYITQTSKQKLSFSQDFLVYRLKLLFEQQSEEKQNDLSQDKGHAVKTYLQFNNLYMELENQIESCAKNHLEYWRELKQDFPSVLKLWNLAKHFEIEIKNVSQLFLRICEIYSNNIMTLILYSNFLKYIVLDMKEYHKLKQKIKSEKFSAQSNTKDVNDMKFRQNSNLCTITITTHMNNIGIIINSNSELLKILGYTKQEVMGQKITKIMPKHYYDIHDSFVTKYLNRPDKQIESKEFSVFALCKKGYLVECNILTKLIPEIENGFHLVGFIKKIEETSRYLPHYIMYDGDSNNIEGISQSCVDSLGMANGNIDKGGNTTQITINYLFPQVDFDELDNRPELKLQGFQTIIDTRVLSQDFAGFDSYQGQSETDYNKTGRMNVKVYLSKQSTYGKLKLKFIKFFLLNEQQQQKRQEDENRQQNMKHQQQSSQQYCEDQDDDEEDVNNAKKYRSFVSEGYIKCLIIFLSIGIFIFMAMEISLMSFDVAKNIIDSNELSYSFNVLNESNTLLNCLNNANFDTKKLKLTYQLSLTQEAFQKYQQHMRQSAEYMQNAIVDFVRTSVILEDTFKYYQPKVYSAYYFYNNDDAPITQTFQYNDALFEYITTIVAFSTMQYQALNIPQITNTTILSNFFFIETNGMATIFFTIITNQVNIFAFFKERFKYYLKSRQLLLGLRIMSVMVIFCLILPIIVQLNKINQKLLGIYKLIPIRDIKIIEEDSKQFILNNFQDTSLSGPVEEIMEVEKKKQNIQELESQVNKSNFLPLLSDGFSPASTLRPAETSDALLISIDQQKVALKRNSLSKDMAQQRNKIPKVKLSQIPSNKSQITFLTLLITVLLSYCVGEYFLHYFFFNPLESDHDAMTYYKTALSTNRQTLLNAQEYFAGGGETAVINFNRSYDLLYYNLEGLYNIQPDVNRNREVIYGSVEQLKTMFKTADVSMMKTAKFQRIQASIDLVQINLINQSNQFIAGAQNRIKNNFQKTCYIKFIVEFLVVLILIKILFSGYLGKVRTRTHRSVSMALMIPIKIIMNNPDILAIL